MSYDKQDFIVMTDNSGSEIIVNISKIKFVMKVLHGLCRLYFGAGDDDYIIVKTTIDDFMEIL